MIARKYNRLIAIWQSTEVSDGFGGSTVTDEFVANVWANVATKKAYVTNEQGQRDNFVQTIFTIRNREISVKDNFIKFNNLTYNIDSVLDVDLDNIDIQLLATQRE